MLIDLHKQLMFSGNSTYRTDSVIDPAEQIDMSGTDVKMNVVYEKKTRKDSQVSNSSKNTK